MDDRWWSVALATIGVGILVTAGWRQTANPPTAPWLHRVIDLVTIGGAGVGYLYGAYWYRDRPFDAERYPMIVTWIIGFGVLFVSLGVISVYLGSNTVSPFEVREVVYVTSSVGLFAGLLLGSMHSQSIQHAETAARVEAEANALAAERDRLEALTDLLRHYILNAVTIISGYADQLRGDVPNEAEPALDVIDERAELIGTLIKHIGSMYQQERDIESRQLESVIESAIVDVDDRHDVTIEASACPATVLIDDRFEDALRLLCEAVITTTDDGTMTISCYDDAEDRVTVTVTATPASIPAPLMESLFEPISSGVALELYIVDQLLKEIGEIQLRETPRETVRFDVTLTTAARPE